MRKAYLHYENGNIVSSIRNHKPKGYICECPKKEDGSYEVDVSVIEVKEVWEDPNTGEVLEVDESTPEDAFVFKKAFIVDSLVSSREAEEAQEKRNRKLKRLRRLRELKIKEADAQIFMHQDSDSSAKATEADWRSYRISLRAVTDTYKDSEDETKGTADLDVYKEDMSDFDGWPVKPS